MNFRLFVGLAVGIVGFTFFLLWANTAKADIIIVRDGGGRILEYVDRFLQVRKSGGRVFVDGECASACTLVLGLIPPERICVTGRAKFSFHSASRPDENGLPVYSKLGTEAMLELYPPEINRWLKKNGGLTPKLIYLEGAELARMYQPCNLQALHAHGLY